MIPGLLAEDVSSALKEFIITGFETETQPFAGEFRRLVEELQEGEAFIKGPYISIGLPFKPGVQTKTYFSSFETDFPPYLHQQLSWDRVSSKNQGKNTIVATGTGSGKTECFMYPVLEHCQRELTAGKKGIKAIIVYPMNALATDQAKRFAKAISKQPNLSGVRVGLFVGGNDKSSAKHMTAEQVITCKDSLRLDPPDILLTNYKMLDYLLMRPKDQTIWQHNVPETLRYLIVDELHTFDGAQGTDLALLIRRLKARLQTPRDHLVCIGTSATLGSDDQIQGLASYAGEIFDSIFDSNAIITEQRMAADEFIDVLDYLNLNPALSPLELLKAREKGLQTYLNTAYSLFFLEEPEQSLENIEQRIALGKALRCHGQVQNILRLQQNNTVTINEMSVPIRRALRNCSQNEAYLVVQGLLALLAHARDENGQPLVQLRVQLWTRELRRIVGELANSDLESEDDRQLHEPKKPILWFADDTPKDEQPVIRLPLVQCRECHGTAWLTRVDEGQIVGQKIADSLQEIYSAFFSRHSETTILVPAESWPGNQSPKDLEVRCCRQCGTISSASLTSECQACNASAQDQVRVVRPHMQKQVSERKVNRVIHENSCPYCMAAGGLVVFGARAASLSAVAIHRLFSSQENDDKKLITFSDSVQDAAHRAGFFGARTWHNNIRMAISQLLGQQNEIPLTDIGDRFEKFWLGDGSIKGWSVERYLREFMPPESRYRADFERFEQTGVVTDPAYLFRIIKQRVVWQVCEDLSWRSQVGRSLNRVGVAALTWQLSNDQDQRDSSWEDLCIHWKSKIKDELGFDFSDMQSMQFLLGIIHRLITKGALATEFLASYIDSGAQAYVINRLDYTPSIGPSTPRPSFPATAKENGFEVVVAASGTRSTRSTWFTRWLSLFQGLEQLINTSQLDDIVLSALDTLAEYGLLLVRHTARGTKVWGLNPKQLVISSNVVEVPMNHGRSLYVAANDGGKWHGVFDVTASSIDKCYEKNKPIKQSFFKQLYQQGEICRVIAHEHTGLLERAERERIESSFIKGNKPWEYNLLSATPTLEMGIDIGDLSSVLLCSVPPAQANYLQRAGRGGRRDGNSFVLTVANGRPHDLVFYADPKRMLDTPVEPPAIFLKARHVLRRQLLAYAFDCWTFENKGINSLPYNMQLVLDAVEKSKPSVFPYTLLDYISENMQSIWEGFSENVAHSLAEDELMQLKEVLFGGGQVQEDPLHRFVNTRLKVVADERRDFINNIEAINKKIKSLQKMPDDEHNRKTLYDLEEELVGFKRLRSRLNNKDTLNFFTDEGLLPNYAFPEEGATLHSIIFRRDDNVVLADGAERQWVKSEYEYQRPAQAALVELAPNSVFYAGNRKVKVSRVETAKGRNIQHWRFCPRCNYSACMDDPKKGYHSPACPRCQSVMWADASAATNMLKMTQVYAFTNAKDAQLDDGTDDREPEFFNRQMLIDFDQKDILSTWTLDDEKHPFGFEFIRNVDFLEVNFGRTDQEGESTEIAGKLLNRSGFEICESCGKVQQPRRQAEHLNTCPHYRPQSNSSSNNDDLNGIVRCLYLYRQFSSEAMRILLPNLSFGGTEEQVQSFVAALQLGLKQRFGGKVDHLRVAHQSEPVGNSDTRRHFLVLYDSVPGGTGYLQELLANEDNMKAVFINAWDTMQGCDCYNNTMDGCYRCLLEYRNSYGMEQTKKSVALSMLAEIIKPENKWVLNKHGLSSLKQTPWVDSELEARFPMAIEAFSGHPAVGCEKIRLRKDVVNQKNGYRIFIGNVVFTMEPHVLLGASEGVAFQSEADFVICNESTPGQRIAVFLDGFQFHHDKVQDDLLKRQALMHAGYIVWSLNWYDINHVLGDKASSLPLLSQLIADPYHQQAVSGVVKIVGAESIVSWASHTNFERLMKLLHSCEKLSFANLAGQSWCWVLAAIPASHWSNLKAQTEKAKMEFESLPYGFLDRLPENIIAGSTIESSIDGGVNSKLSFVCGQDALQKGLTSEASIVLSYDSTITQETPPESVRILWQKFWYSVNVLQFLPNFYALTPASKMDGIATSLEWPTLSVKTDNIKSANYSELNSSIDDHIKNSFSLSWLEELDFKLKHLLEPIADSLLKTAQEEPVVFYELANSYGEIVAESELAWIARKVVLLVDEQIDSVPVFEKHGWRSCLTVDELLKDFGIEKVEE